MNNFIKLLLSLCFLISLDAAAQPFITKWDLSIPGSGATQLSFGVGTTGVVNYTWETIPAGTNGAGTFTGTTATITGLPVGATIRLSIDTTNFNRININNGNDKNRLIDVEQWGGVKWSSMEDAFYGCQNLNCNATDVPDLTSVTSMSAMFRACSSLIGPTNIGTWNTSTITDMSMLFGEASSFNGPIGLWNTQSVTDMTFMFGLATSFNQPIGNWDVSSVTKMSSMFRSATSFNQPIGNWNTQNVTHMSWMFYEANFNQPIGNWNTQNVVDMYNMFANTNNFNHPIGNWNTHNVINMTSMFRNAIMFNQSIGNWNTQNVNSMNGMFANASNFNQPIENWNIQNVVGMNWMFEFAINFNQPMGNWNTQNVSTMDNMFYGASNFNQPIGTWDIQKVTGMYGMLSYSGLNCANYTATLNGWNSNVLTPNVLTLGANGLLYGLDALTSRTNLDNIKGWNFIGDYPTGYVCNPNGLSNIEDDKQAEACISPNPSFGNPQLIIKSNLNQNSKIKIMDVYGKIVHETQFQVYKGVNKFYIPTSNLALGLNFVQLDLDQEHILLRFNLIR